MTPPSSLAPAADADPSPRAVRRSLRALADGSAPDAFATDPERVVDAAEATLPCAPEAVSYLVTDGLGRLDGAIAAADRRGDPDLVRRGRRVRRTLRRLSAALTESGGPKEPSPSTEDEPDAGPDHFHPARGTVLGDSGQRSSR